MPKTLSEIISKLLTDNLVVIISNVFTLLFMVISAFIAIRLAPIMTQLQDHEKRIIAIEKVQEEHKPQMIEMRKDEEFLKFKYDDLSKTVEKISDRIYVTNK